MSPLPRSLRLFWGMDVEIYCTLFLPLLRWLHIIWPLICIMWRTTLIYFPKSNWLCIPGIKLNHNTEVMMCCHFYSLEDSCLLTVVPSFVSMFTRESSSPVVLCLAWLPRFYSSRKSELGSIVFVLISGVFCVRLEWSETRLFGRTCL